MLTLVETTVYAVSVSIADQTFTVVTSSVFDDTARMAWTSPGIVSLRDHKDRSSGHVPAGGEQTLVKRVIGVGGDHVTCQEAPQSGSASTVLGSASPTSQTGGCPAVSVVRPSPFPKDIVGLE